MATPLNRVALFVDVDNVLPFWRDDAGLDRSEYLQRSDFQSFLDRVEAQVAHEGTVVLREAYGKWDNPARDLAGPMMYHRYGYALQHIPPLARRGKDEPLKNAGDILLASRAILASVSTFDTLDTIVIAAADNDYQPLAVELKRLGMRVVLLSFPLVGQQRTLLKAAFDGHLEIKHVKRWVELDAIHRSRRQQQSARPVGGAAPKPRESAPARIARAHEAAPAARTPSGTHTARPVEAAGVRTLPAPGLIASSLWEAAVAQGSTIRSLLSALDSVGFDRATANEVLQRVEHRGLMSTTPVDIGRAISVDVSRHEWESRFGVELMYVLVNRALRSTREIENTATRWDQALLDTKATFAEWTHDMGNDAEVALAARSAAEDDGARGSSD